MAKIAVIVGSVRSDRQGIKVANWIVKKLKERNHDVFLVDPAELQLPLLDKMYKEIESPPENLKKLYTAISESDGYIPVTPEYNHSTSGAMKNTLDYLLEEYFFKPSAIVSYSAGPFGGVLAGNHLRQVLAEMGSPAIPSQLPISKVQDVFGEQGELLDENYDRRAKRFLDEFEWYVDAFLEQRKKGTPY
ncbi:MAG: NAD(P)H-dependent oxidoreductase [Nitrosopumilaceae archaeon]|jgi:NAD(P)H-dependent FMN reductase|uniref:NAD(P)H-dependent oxidoreductase n=1 Tax=Candidatus Nitrosomaritimum aestuariumsis TaxID=3342354 RepID=A0AC60W4W6_9ARCH|nr:NAD(P)H-dependent oxidoreductase [Nitrosopumilaceae archaeon]MBA4459950.1 NAD(P)H-dependent oxidoreductase [Nitrosopumilaceae archaeon]NCF22575.1 NADPH-dependent FMN reductase [Nitrosopumilaceae archaeon]